MYFDMSLKFGNFIFFNFLYLYFNFYILILLEVFFLQHKKFKYLFKNEVLCHKTS